MMPTCEKCWSDTATYGDDHAGAYRALVEDRTQNKRTCTPEEQAGPGRTTCQECGLVAVHQYAGVCMGCGHDHGETR